jgi:spore maturation protein CgeB
VLAFGEAIRRIYQNGFGIPKVWTFHEAADTTVFKPFEAEKMNDIVWIGNWGDEERTRELMEFLVGPAKKLHGRRVLVHGVRYPKEGVEMLQDAGIDFRGYLPNLSAPAIYAQSCVALHVPRRQYTNGLSGIPTIRVFEALACGIPLVCSPWTDAENLFRPGEDYLIAEDSKSMAATLEKLISDTKSRQEVINKGLETIRARHTCRHRAEQLIDICGEMRR